MNDTEAVPVGNMSKQQATAVLEVSVDHQLQLSALVDQDAIKSTKSTASSLKHRGPRKGTGKTFKKSKSNRARHNKEEKTKEMSIHERMNIVVSIRLCIICL